MADDSRPPRRRSPWWIREYSFVALHRLGGRLLHDWRTDGLTDGQLHLLEGVESELAYRNRHRPYPDRCTCQLCCEPFPLADDELGEPPSTL